MKSTRSDQSAGDIVAQRLDTWLWVSRFYRSRKLATAAVASGHIRVNNVKVKPGKLIKSGDALLIKKNHQLYQPAIIKLSPRRLPAQSAQELYREPQWSIDNRNQQIELQKNNRLGVQFDHNKPGKRDRMRLIALKQNTPT